MTVTSETGRTILQSRLDSAEKEHADVKVYLGRYIQDNPFDTLGNITQYAGRLAGLSGEIRALREALEILGKIYGEGAS